MEPSPEDEEEPAEVLGLAHSSSAGLDGTDGAGEAAWGRRGRRLLLPRLGMGLVAWSRLRACWQALNSLIILKINCISRILLFRKQEYNFHGAPKEGGHIVGHLVGARDYQNGTVFQKRV